MRRKKRLTQEECDLIVDHVTPLREGAVRQLDELPKRDTEWSGTYIKNQRAYWKQVIGTIDTIIGQAKQRMGAENGGGRTAV